MGISLSETAREITRSNFVGKDFDTYVTEIKEAIQDIFGSEVASNIVASEQGIMLIEAFAFGLSTLSWYGDRQADETNLDIPGGARVRANAISIARILGYAPHAAVAPVVEITMTIDAPFQDPSATPPGPGLPSRLTLEKGRKLVSTEGVAFEMVEEVIFEAGEGGPKTFLVRQGASFSTLFVSNGQKNQRFFIENLPQGLTVAEGTVEVRVAGSLWRNVPLMQFVQENIAELSLGSTPPFIRTGDGIAGNIPPQDVEVRVDGFSTLGPNGAVISNTVTRFVAPLVAGTTTVTATLVHDEASTVGSFEETLDSIKTNAPLVFQTAQRSVTILDLDGLINSFVDPTWGAVAKGRATTPRSAEGDAELQTHIALIRAAGVDETIITNISNYWNKVVSSNCKANVVMAQILATDASGRYVSAPVGLARALESYLDGRAESTAKVWAVDGSINVLSVDILAEIKVEDDFDSLVQSAAIKQSVEASLQLALLDRDYGVSLQLGDLYESIEGIEGIRYSNIRVLNLTDRLDSFGNLPVEDYEVITMGLFPSVTILES